MISKYF